MIVFHVMQLLDFVRQSKQLKIQNDKKRVTEKLEKFKNFQRLVKWFENRLILNIGLVLVQDLTKRSVIYFI